MSRTLRPLAALAAMIALISAGCSNAPAATGTGTGSSGNNTAATAPAQTSIGSGGNSTDATREQAVKFAECMRANGVRDFPDPDASGQLTIDAIANGSSIDTNSAAFKRAISACRDLEPPGFTGSKRSPEQQKAALEFAQCMRDNGVKDFPDPTDNGPIINVNGAHSIPGFQAAIQKCRDYLAGALENPGALGGQ
jgi:hypothetical protein